MYECTIYVSGFIQVPVYMSVLCTNLLCMPMYYVQVYECTMNANVLCKQVYYIGVYYVMSVLGMPVYHVEYMQLRYSILSLSPKSCHKPKLLPVNLC